MHLCRFRCQNQDLTPGGGQALFFENTWEDWAETFAHYLHIVDTLETARVYGLALRPKAASGALLPDLTARRLDSMISTT